MADDADVSGEIGDMNKADTISAIVAQVRYGVPSNGVCRSCGEVIEPDRIRTLPYTRHCADCAREIEEEAGKRRRM